MNTRNIVEFLPLSDDPRLNPSVMAEIEQIATVCGWSEVGGKLIRDINGNARSRTSWIPVRDFWLDRPNRVTHAVIKNAIEKQKSEKKLTKLETSAIRFLIDVATTIDFSHEQNDGIDLDIIEIANIQELAIKNGLNEEEIEEIEERAAIMADGKNTEFFILSFKRIIDHAIKNRAPCTGNTSEEFSLISETEQDIRDREQKIAARKQLEEKEQSEETKRLTAIASADRFELICDGGSSATREAEQAGCLALCFDSSEPLKHESIHEETAQSTKPTKSEIFRHAHALAKANQLKNNEYNYRALFAESLREVYQHIKATGQLPYIDK